MPKPRSSPLAQVHARVLSDEGDDEHQRSKLSLDTLILTQFQQLTSHVDSCMLKQEALIKDLYQSSRSADSPISKHEIRGESPSLTVAPWNNTPCHNRAKQVSYMTAPRDSEATATAETTVYVEDTPDVGKESNDLLRLDSTPTAISTPVRITTESEVDHRRRRESMQAAGAALFSRISTVKVQQNSACIAKHPAFESVFAIAVISNSVFIGIEVEVNAQDPQGTPPFFFYVITQSFALIFLIEMLCRLCAFRLQYFIDRGQVFWNYLDLFLVLSSVVEFIVDMASLGGDRGKAINPSNNLRIIRVVRITRLVRVVRVIRIVRFIRALRELVSSIANTLKSVLWAMLLLIMIIYVFGVVFTQTATHYIETNDEPDLNVLQYWANLPKSMFTLFKSVSGGISWQEVAYALAEMSGEQVLLFICFIAFMHFALINVITGVFCQSAIESASHDYDMVAQSQLANREMTVSKLRELFATIDKDQSGELTIAEFEAHLEKPEVQAYFTALEIDASDVWTLFKLLDRGESHGVDVEEFLLGCMRLRGVAKAIEIAKMAYDLKVHRKQLNKAIARIEVALNLNGQPAGSISSIPM